jgi:hypothetical protein
VRCANPWPVRLTSRPRTHPITAIDNNSKKRQMSDDPDTVRPSPLPCTTTNPCVCVQVRAKRLAKLSSSVSSSSAPSPSTTPKPQQQQPSPPQRRSDAPSSPGLGAGRVTPSSPPPPPQPKVLLPPVEVRMADWEDETICRVMRVTLDRVRAQTDAEYIFLHSVLEDLTDAGQGMKSPVLPINLQSTACSLLSCNFGVMLTWKNHGCRLRVWNLRLFPAR